MNEQVQKDTFELGSAYVEQYARHVPKHLVAFWPGTTPLPAHTPDR